MGKYYKLSKLIKFTGFILILLFGAIIVFLNILNYHKIFSKISAQVTDQIISSKKEDIKDNVFQVVNLIKYAKNNYLKNAYNIVKKDVYIAYQIAENIYKKNKTALSDNQITHIISETLRSIKLKNSGYFFIVNSQGKVLLNAANPLLEGKNLLYLKDNESRYILKDMLDIALNRGEGYYSYNWHKPDDFKKYYKKISFVKYFSPLDFYIGKGMYLDEIKKKVQKDLIEKISAMRFGKEGYIFLNKFDGTALVSNGKILNYNKKLWEQFGKNSIRRTKVKKIFQMELNAAMKKKGGYISYTWQKLTTPDKISKKISFIYGVKDWQWIIGAGVYLDDVEKILSGIKQKLKNDLERSIFTLIVIIIAIVLVFIIITNRFSDFINEELMKLAALFKKSIAKNKPIAIANVKIKEIRKFAGYINIALGELKQSEEKFRKIFEESEIPMLLLDKDRFIDCNKATVRLLKADKKEDILVHPGILSPEYQEDGTSSIEKASLIIEDVYKTGKPKYFEWLHKRFNGEIFPSYVNLSLIPYENRKVIFVTWSDISELKNLQQEMEKEKEQLEITLQSIGDAVISTDVLGKIELMNRVAENLTGWSIDEAIGKELREVFRIINFYTRELVANPVSKVLKTGKIVGLANHTVLISKNGKEYHIADSAAPIKGKNSSIIGVVLVFRDVTDKVKGEQELIKAEKLKSVGVLAGGIAHDFNNILTGITGNLSLIKLQISKKSFSLAKILERIDRIEHSLERATSLTNQLLTFTKSGELIKESVNLSQLIKQTAEFHLTGSNIKPIYDFKEKEWKLNADKGQLSHVIANLIINAKDAMKQGGNIFISVDKVINPKIANKQHNGEYIKITVRDEGEGICKTHIENIFDPFYTTKDKGSGLGLSIVYSIIEKHYGYITCESEVDKGSIFTIFLPLENPDIENIGIESKIDSFSVSQYVKNVLILDDNEMILETTKEIFNFLGVNCVTTKDGAETLEIFRQKQFDLVITDLTIPGGTGGKEIIKELVAIEPEVIVIVASGYSDAPIMSDYKKYGFKGRLKKPFTITSIEEEIKKIFKS